MRLISYCLLTCLLTSCFGSSFAYREVEVPDMASGVVWSRAVQAVKRHGYKTDVAATDKGLLVYQSRWKGAAGAFRRAERRRMRMEIEHQEGGVNLLRFYVERQVIDDMGRNLRPREEDWQAAGQHSIDEEVLQAMLRGNLGMPLLQGQKGPAEPRDLDDEEVPSFGR